MRAPPDTVQPITAARLREIIGGLVENTPPEPELVALAEELTKLQRCNDPPPPWWDNPYMTIRMGEGATRKQTPVWLQPAFARGQAQSPHKRRRRTWQDLAPDIAAGFRRLFPGREFGDRDGPLQHFVAAVIQAVLPDQHPSSSAVGQYLARRSRKTRPRR